MQPTLLHKGKETSQIETGFLGMEIHICKVRIRRCVEGPTVLMVKAKTIMGRQILEQCPAQPQTLS